ncbi:helix-turn-helix domain-containing protein [Microbulbifer sp. SH-1]|uniref:helix-turn-helix domain-containing protein n=1 Tax=Microbulbifer sp. SH-1 TaxID=2681547 RepID=UPI001407748A|nr:helix-turn-helix transcriptional regulator [Microbulbifer sp. SH-1]QIL91318.1 helix-turn-helix domain-containing protein [Microbulbifer sp. SH-1]
MNGIVFNIHDVALLLIAGECGMLAMLFFAYRSNRRLAHSLMAIFMLMNMLIAIDTLICRGEVFRFWVFFVSPDLFFLFGFAYFLLGPALYFYTRAVIFRESSFRRLHALHLIPAATAQLYLFLVYHRYPADVQINLVLGKSVFLFSGGYHDLFWLAQKAMVVVYGIACFFLLARDLVLPKHQRSISKNSIFVWLHLLIGGFLLVWIWSLAAHIWSVFRSVDASNVMGITGNYMTVLLTTVLMFYSLLGSGLLGGLRPGKNTSRGDPAPMDQSLIERICAAMESGRLFLNPRLTVEEFAGHVKLPPRQVSSAIKSRYGCNFLEYVNSYRVQEAKIGLADPANRDESVLDIASKSGFNSKATFNRFFKKFAGVTPTEFRRRCLSGLPD